MKPKETVAEELARRPFTGVLDKILNAPASKPSPRKPHYSGKFNAFNRLTNANK